MIASRLLISAIALAWALPGHAAPAVRPFKPDASSCASASAAQLAWLDRATWAPFDGAVRACRVRQGGRAAKLLIVSVWESDFYADKPDATVQVKIPLPQLFAPNGRRLGELPVSFPTDQPSELELRFSRWMDGLPGEIHLCVLSPGVSGNFALPSLHLAADGLFLAGAAPPRAQQDACHAE